MAKTIIQKARELINEFGKEKAIKHFEDKIKELGQPKSFEDICVLSGLETVIQFINDSKETN